MSVTPIVKPFAPDEIPATLRQIADDIEAGIFGLRTTCVVVLGHTESRPCVGCGDRVERNHFDIFGCGPRCDVYTVRGLLLTAATRPTEPVENEEDSAS